MRKKYVFNNESLHDAVACLAKDLLKCKNMDKSFKLFFTAKFGKTLIKEYPFLQTSLLHILYEFGFDNVQDLNNEGIELYKKAFNFDKHLSTNENDLTNAFNHLVVLYMLVQDSFDNSFK